MMAAACCATMPCWPSSATPPASCATSRICFPFPPWGSAAKPCLPLPRSRGCFWRRAPPKRPPARASKSPAARCCAAKRRPWGAAPSSPCATFFTMCRRARSFCAPNRPSWRTFRSEIAGGKMLRCEEAALGRGTVITVRDLFYNVPARKKFLRTEQTELAHIASLVTHYSLAHADKTFHLTSGTSELLHVTPVATLQERVYQVFGSQVLDDLVDIGLREKDLYLPPPSVPPSEALAEYRREPGPDDDPPTRAFRLRGFFSRPQVQKGNRNSIFIFVNGRLIRDRLLLHALSSAYHNLIPPSSYPFALLFLECDPEEVDVNVHPSKTEVRFRHGNFVHDFVRDTLRDRLMESRPAPSFSPRAPLQAPAAQPAAGLPYSEFSQMIENQEPPAESVLEGPVMEASF